MVNLHSIRIFHSADTGENIGGNSGEKSTEMPEGFDKEFWDSLSEEHREELRNLSKDISDSNSPFNITEDEGPINRNADARLKARHVNQLITSNEYSNISTALSVYQQPNGSLIVPKTVKTVLESFDNEELNDLDNLLKENGIEFGGNLENLLYVTINFRRLELLENKFSMSRILLKPSNLKEMENEAKSLIIDDIKYAFKKLKDVHRNPVIAVEIQTAADIKGVSAKTIKNRMAKARITDSDFNNKGELFEGKRFINAGTDSPEQLEGLGLLDALERRK